jgi:heme/copper-type cytochrome/quinol oxidase subunit 2
MRGLRVTWPWLALGAAALVLALTPTRLLEAGQRALGTTPGAGPVSHHFRIEASSFAYAPAELRVAPGDTVTLELAPTDYVHGLFLDGYELEIQADPGQPARLTFVADRAGSFRFRCSVTCGPLHPFMIGKLNVGTNWTWLRALGLAALAVMAGLGLARR